MGNSCFSKSAQVLDTACVSKDTEEEKDVCESAMFFLCTQKGLILDVSASVEEELLFSKDDLLNQFIGIIMSPFISFLHKKVFLKRLQTVTGLEHSRLLFKLKDLSEKRPFIVYDLHGRPVYVSVNIVLHTADEIAILYDELKMNSKFDVSALNKYEKYVLLQINKMMSKTSVAQLDTVTNMNSATTSRRELLYAPYKSDMSYIMCANEDMTHTFKVTTNNVVVIRIDIADFAKIQIEKGPHHTANISAKFYGDVISTIKSQFYPFIYIYEIIGDCFMFIVNADWTYNMSSFCAIISVYFVKHLLKKVRDYVNIKAGLSYGKISYGFIGDNLRFFGETVNLAARLESECGHNEILMSTPLFQKLKSELISARILNKQTSSSDITSSISDSEANSGLKIAAKSSEVDEDADVYHLFDINKDFEKKLKSLKGYPKDVECHQIMPHDVSNILSFLDSEKLE